VLSSRIVAVSSIVLLAIVGGCSSNPDAPSPTPSPAPGSSSSVTIPMGASTLGNQAYAPDDVNVAIGETVTWVNADSVPHTSTSDATGWDSGTVGPGGRFSRAFQTAGTFKYHCTIHPGMIGSVVVR
jgi:plastocyanin